MTRPGQRSTAKAGISPMPAALEEDASPLGQRGGARRGRGQAVMKAQMGQGQAVWKAQMRQGQDRP